MALKITVDSACDLPEDISVEESASWRLILFLYS
jgi:fatty acid-binding protein DegV